VNRTLIISGIIALIILASIVGFVYNVSDSDDFETLTGTPADNFSEKERDKFCGVSEAKSNQYIREYEIPTRCTQPQAITTDSQGNVWFAESNTGRLAKFDPFTESFSEYNNVLWPTGDNSMIWGLDYHQGTLWFTDDKHDSVWKFDTQTRRYDMLNLPILENSLPQRLQVDDSKIILNDFTGSQIIFLENFQSDEITTYSIPSASKESVLGDFTIDSKNNLWYTNWIPETIGVLARVNQTSFDLSLVDDKSVLEYERFELPSDLKTPNGIAVDNNENIWIADSSSSLVFKFNPENKTFLKFTTFDATELTYGNHTGQVNSTSSNPYWIEKDSSGNLVFNAQGANRIGILNPYSLSLIEYEIPSRNPNWGDCENQNCGLAQIFDFSVDNKKIWFSEWAENKIGFVDTSMPLPFDIETESKEISLRRGSSEIINFSVNSKSVDLGEMHPLIANPNANSGLAVELISKEELPPYDYAIKVTAAKNAFPGTYLILLGSNAEQVFNGKFISVLVE